MCAEMLSELRMDQELRAKINGGRGDGWGVRKPIFFCRLIEPVS